MKCPAAIADGYGAFTLDQIEVEAPIANEVLVRMKAAGICHTDHASMGWKRPLVMGHEGAGVVEALGEGVTNVRVGDRVVLNWAIPCGLCFQCRSGNEVLCEWSKPAHVLRPSSGHAHAGGTRWLGQPIDRSFNLGTLCGFALVRKEAVTPLPETVPFSSGCITGCGVMTGFGSVVNIANVQAGQSVAVIGCGGVGLNVIQGARIAGATRIIAVDVEKEALARARSFGSTHSLIADRDDYELRKIAAKVRALTDDRGADFAFEATSIPELAFTPLRLIRDGGLALQVSGINSRVNVPMPWFMWNKRYVTPLYGGCVPARDFPRVFRHYQAGELQLDELVTRTYRLGQLTEAFDDMIAGRNAKGVILFDH